MEFKQLQDMALFALVAECGSFTAAAQRVGLPKSSVSQRISQLEQTLGLRLLNRTTRQLNLTFAGERYLEHCQAMMSAAERADLALQRLRDNPSGRLRISTPAGLGATLVARLAADFQRQYPDVSLEVSVSDAMVDLVQEGFDAALRTGKPQDSSLIGRRLGYAPRYLLAAPSIWRSIRRSNTRSSCNSIAASPTAPGRPGTCAAATTTTVGSCRWRTPPTTCCMRVNALSPVRGSRCCRRFSAARWWRRSCWWKSCRRGARRAMSCIWSTRAAS